VEVPERDISIPSDKHPLFAGTMGYHLLLGSISLGERRKVAEQREMLRAAGLPQAGANYPPEKKAESTGKWLSYNGIVLGPEAVALYPRCGTDLPATADLGFVRRS
jgi:hypothetical protein